MKYDVFISYSRKDTAIADQICAAFDKAGISYFIDRQGIVGSGEFPEILANAILESKYFLFLASQNSYSSKYTKKEIHFAFNRKPSGTLFPYIIDESKLPNSIELVFSDINTRSLKVHPIETVLVIDFLNLLGYSESTTANAHQSNQIGYSKTDSTINHGLELERKQRNGKYGFVDKQDNVIIPFIYDYASIFCEGLSRVEIGSRWGFIDKQGNIIVPFEYEDAWHYSEGIAAVKKGGKWGCVNKQGKIVIPFEYDYVGSHHDNRICVTKDNKNGFIDSTGLIVIPFIYDDARQFSEGLAAVRKDGKWGFIDEHNEIVIPFMYYSAHRFINNIALVSTKYCKYGFIDKRNQILIPFEYDGVFNSKIEYFNEGLCCVAKNKKCGFIDKKGHVIIPFKFGEPASYCWQEGIFFIQSEEGETNWSDNKRWHDNYKEGKFGAIDKKGNVIIPFKYDDIKFDYDAYSVLFEGLACVKKHGKWGYIDKKGKVIIPFRFKEAEYFHNGKAKVTKKNLFGKKQTFYINKQGNRID